MSHLRNSAHACVQHRKFASNIKLYTGVNTYGFLLDTAYQNLNDSSLLSGQQACSLCPPLMPKYVSIPSCAPG